MNNDDVTNEQGNTDENKGNDDKSVESEDEDISTALNEELNELKAEAVKSPSQRRFQVCS